MTTSNYFNIHLLTLSNSYRKKTYKITLIVFFLILLITNINSRIKIDNIQKTFIDEENRVNIFHGVNIVYKLAPFKPVTSDADWSPFYSLNSRDIEIMKEYGFNIVRLGITWESIEKKREVFDSEYLEEMHKIVENLGKAGIKVIIDAHQDMFSRVFCGEGVPAFYAQDLINSKLIDNNCSFSFLAQFNKLMGACIPLKSYNWEYQNYYMDTNVSVPKLESCGTKFIKYHQSSELSTAYQAFYENKLNLQDKFINFWKFVAKKFKDNKHVLGLDLWNEPWPGNLFINANALLPGYATNNQVIPFYQKLYNELKSIDSEFIYLLETVPFPDTLPFFGGYTVAGFNSPPLPNDINLNHQALNLHSYCCMASDTACAGGEPTLTDSLDLCLKFHQRKMEKNKSQANDLGIPLIITEFGSCTDSQACFNEIKAFLDNADKYLTSWAYWMYKPYGDHTTTARDNLEGLFYANGNPQELKIKALTRTYIQAYQGIPISTQFDYDSGFFLTKFYLDFSINAASRVYFNKKLFYRNFNENYKFIVTDNNDNDLIYETSDYIENGKKYDNYLNIKITQNNISLYNSFINGVSKNNNGFSFFMSSLLSGQTTNMPIVKIGIIPKILFDTSTFDRTKTVTFNVSKSAGMNNTIRIVDKKNLLNNLRVDFKINSLIADKNTISYVKINQDYKISNKDNLIRLIAIETPYGSIRIQNIFNNKVEIIIQ